MFHANRIDEVVGAVAALSSTIPHRRLFLIGFSLGGNFALRVGLRAPGEGLAIDRIVAVNPAIDPRSTLAAIDRYPLYRRYFLQRWRRSLELKQRAFPDRYDFAGAKSLQTVRELSEHVIPRYTPFATLEEYFAGYTLRGDQLAENRRPDHDRDRGRRPDRVDRRISARCLAPRRCRWRSSRAAATAATSSVRRCGRGSRRASPRFSPLSGTGDGFRWTSAPRKDSEVAGGDRPWRTRAFATSSETRWPWSRSAGPTRSTRSPTR